MAYILCPPNDLVELFHSFCLLAITLLYLRCIIASHEQQSISPGCISHRCPSYAWESGSSVNLELKRVRDTYLQILVDCCKADMSHVLMITWFTFIQPLVFHPEWCAPLWDPCLVYGPSWSSWLRPHYRWLPPCHDVVWQRRTIALGLQILGHPLTQKQHMQITLFPCLAAFHDWHFHAC